ncbi:hypothetical protein D3C72_2164830 [compost metagenome]
MQARQALVRVFRKDVDDLDAEIAALAPGRHDQRGAVGIARLEGVDVARGHRGAAAKRFPQGGNDGVKGQGAAGLFCVDKAHWIVA